MFTYLSLQLIIANIIPTHGDNTLLRFHLFYNDVIAKREIV